MKTVRLYLILIISSCLVGACAASEDIEYKKKTDEMLKKLDEDLKKNQEEMDAKFGGIFNIGGQPGQIVVNGVAVKNEELKELDSKIKTEQKVGTSCSGKDIPPISKAAQISLSQKNGEKTQTSSEKKADTSYVNFGCSQFDKKFVEGLTESKPSAEKSDILFVTANTILICGKLKLPSLYTIYSAAHIILMDADYEYTNAMGTIVLETEGLTLIGENKIVTRGLDAQQFVMSAPSIALTVSKEISGDGSILLSSVGGNCVEKKDKE